ncbi:MAG TPA: DUF2804 family protein [Solirubrobacterales bacterium]
MRADAQLPWRGPGQGRPDLPIPPGKMPLWRDGSLRKRWRYVAAFDEEMILCAARAQVGPFAQSFWVAWDRRRGHRFGNTILRRSDREVKLSGPRIGIEARDLRASLVLGESTPVESICPSGTGWGWTRKRVGMPVNGLVKVGVREWPIHGQGVDDESAGYHQRHTSWLWSAGVGRAEDGRALAWNLVEGINDPPQNSERAIWVEDEPSEPAPVSFDGLDAIEFADGGLLRFDEECERARSDNLLVLRSRYRLRFGTYSGSLNGIVLDQGLGVMEEHRAVW